MNERKEESEFISFKSEALRSQRRGTYEQLLCQILIQSVTSKPLKKISSICEAAMTDPDLEKHGINSEFIDIASNVATAFERTVHMRLGSDYFCYISWPFELTEKNYIRYIKPWRHGALLFYAYLGREWSADQRKQEIEEHLAKLPHWQFFFTVTTRVNLADTTYQTLVGQFISWASPQIMKVFRELTKLVQPSLYKEMLALLTSKGESENESSMGSRQ